MSHSSQNERVTDEVVWHVPGRLGGAAQYTLTVDFDSRPSGSFGAKGMMPAPLLQGSYASGEAYVRERLLDLRAQDQRASLWKHRLVDLRLSNDVDAISETIDSVLEAVAVYGPCQVDLSSMDFAFANVEHLIAVLRATYTWRSSVPGWSDALAAAPALLDKCGQDAGLLLKGLAR